MRSVASQFAARQDGVDQGQAAAGPSRIATATARFSSPPATIARSNRSYSPTILASPSRRRWARSACTATMPLEVNGPGWDDERPVRQAPTLRNLSAVPANGPGLPVGQVARG